MNFVSKDLLVYQYGYMAGLNDITNSKATRRYLIDIFPKMLFLAREGLFHLYADYGMT